MKNFIDSFLEIDGYFVRLTNIGLAPILNGSGRFAIALAFPYTSEYGNLIERFYYYLQDDSTIDCRIHSSAQNFGDVKIKGFTQSIIVGSAIEIRVIVEATEIDHTPLTLDQTFLAPARIYTWNDAFAEVSKNGKDILVSQDFTQVVVDFEKDKVSGTLETLRDHKIEIDNPYYIKLGFNRPGKANLEPIRTIIRRANIIKDGDGKSFQWEAVKD